MNFSALFTPLYYLDLSPQFSSYNIIFALFFLSLLALKVHIRILTGHHQHRIELRRLLRSKLRNLNTIVIFGFIAVILRYSTLPILSMRLWQYLIALSSLFVLYKIYLIFTKEVHTAVEMDMDEFNKQKYMPQPKKLKKKKRK